MSNRLYSLRFLLPKRKTKFDFNLKVFLKQLTAPLTQGKNIPITITPSNGPPASPKTLIIIYR